MKPSTLFWPLQDRVALLGTVNTNHGEISRTPHVDKLPFISIEPSQEAIMFPYSGTEQHRDDFQVISIPQEEPLHLTDLTNRCPFPIHLAVSCSVILASTGLEPAWQYRAGLDVVPQPLPDTGLDVFSTVEPAWQYCAGLNAVPLPLPSQALMFPLLCSALPNETCAQNFVHPRQLQQRRSFGSYCQPLCLAPSL